jgi:hypothetical protein
MDWQSDQTFNDLEREREMSYTELHPYLRGSQLEGRTQLCVKVEDQATAIAQCILLGNYVRDANLGYAADADYGNSCRDGQWYVHYFRGEWSPWPPPNRSTRAYDMGLKQAEMIEIG